MLAKDLSLKSDEHSKLQPKLKKLQNVYIDRLEPLKTAEHLLDYRVDLKNDTFAASDDEYVLGVDAGSTTTKAVLYNTI